MKNDNIKPMILAPAGNKASFLSALSAGADAIYCGLKNFSARMEGLPTFLQVMEVDPLPQHVKEPRSNPYVFWKAEEVPGGFERDLAEFRKRNPM